MKKRLLLTLLPLAFLVAACSGANRPASSSQTPNPSTTSQPSGDTSSAAGDTSSATGDDSSEAEPEDERAYDALKEEGVEVGIGSVYYTLESQPADPNMSASYNLKGLSVTEGEKIIIYNDGTAVQAWAQADSDNGIYPNYNERPQSTKYEEFTVTATSDEADMYVHISESTGDFMIWLTPTNDGTEGGGGEGGGQTTDSKYAIYSVTNSAKICDLVLDGSKDLQGRDQGIALSVSLTEGDVIQLYDTENSAGWITTIEGYSFGGASADATDWQAYLTAGTDSWTVVQSCTVDIYAKFAFNNDSIYFGLSA